MPHEPDSPDASPPPAQYWTAQERWIWDQTLAGKVANFNVRYDEPQPLDPKQDDPRWSNDDKPWLVSEKFLLDVLGRKPYAEAIPSRGLRIIGARFDSDLDLQGLEVERQVWLDHSRFDGAVDLLGARFDTSLSCERSTFKQVLKMNFAKVGGLLNARYATFTGDVDLLGAKVDGQLDASRATFEANLIMNGLTVGPLLALRAARFAGHVGLGGAKVDGQLDASGATFEAGLTMNGIAVGQNLALRGARLGGDVDLVAAKVDGQLNASGATFEAGLSMNSITVGQSIFRDARFAAEVDLVFAKVNGQLYASGATFAGDVYLSGAKVDGRLDASDATFETGLNMDGLTVGQGVFLGGAAFAGEVSAVFAEVGAIDLGGATFGASVNASGLSTKGELRLDPPPTWGDGARLVLRNTHVGALNDGGDSRTGGNENPWPKRGELELDGFSYGRLVLSRTPRWYIDDWLARDTSYTPQPYQQLAGVLQAQGNPSAANTVLYAARERERSEAWKTRGWPRWLGLSLLWLTISYGLGWRYFPVLIWIGLFTLGVLSCCGRAGPIRWVPLPASHGQWARPLPRQSSTNQGLPPGSTSSPILRRLPSRPSPKIARGSAGACGPASTGCCRSSNSTRRPATPSPGSRADPATCSTSRRLPAMFWRPSSPPVSPA